jgi:phage protein gp15
MNILIDKLPQKIDNIEINTDFRNWMLFELILQDKELSEQEQFLEIINVTLKDGIKVISKLEKNELKHVINNLLWFYTCDRYKNEKNNKIFDLKQDFKTKSKAIYSFEYDAEYIFASFYECYKIDLTKTKMHWWKFKTLFTNLSDNCIFSKIMQYRSIEINSKMSKEERKFYLEKKRIYALPDLRTNEQKENDFANSLFKMM